MTPGFARWLFLVPALVCASVAIALFVAGVLRDIDAATRVVEGDE
ncbi:hypothetical protein [Candidatus Korobacter versatilis]|nr:hypothetical protein [Candidatus Koribacter versatilis]